MPRKSAYAGRVVGYKLMNVGFIKILFAGSSLSLVPNLYSTHHKFLNCPTIAADVVTI